MLVNVLGSSSSKSTLEFLEDIWLTYHFAYAVLNPYCQIMENSSRNFSKILIFRVMSQIINLKNYCNCFSKFQFWGRDLDRLSGKLIH